MAKSNRVLYRPNKADQNLVSYYQFRKEQMDTWYRQTAVRLAKWGRDDYNGDSHGRISNMDMLNVSMSFAIVNQRLSAKYANPSKAEYLTVDEDKDFDVQILREVDRYDKQVGRYNSDYQDMEMTADIEGSCWFNVSWREIIGNLDQTIGVPHVAQERVRMNDMFWDEAARRPRDMNDGISRKTMSYNAFIRIFGQLEGKKGFKNIRAVQPMKRDNCYDEVWREDWEDYGSDENEGNYVTIWQVESKGYVEKGDKKPLAALIANGVVILRKDELFIPTKPDEEPLLSWSKLDGIPSGSMVGTSIPVLIRHLQAAYNRLLTLSVTQAELAVVPPIAIGSGIDWDPQDYPLQSGTTIPTRLTGSAVRDNYHVFQVPDITRGTGEMMERISQDIIMLTGVDIRALFVPATEKAITTENKRQIQEKLLRFSVMWNEENGFYDLALRRLRLIQHYYPKKRAFLVEENGKVVLKTDQNLKIPIKDHETEEVQGKKGNKIKLNFKEGGYTKINITEENLKHDVDLVIEGASTRQERGAIEKKNAMDILTMLMNFPAFAEKLAKNPDKSAEYLLKQANIAKSELFEDESSQSNKMHFAFKEIAAIRLPEMWKQWGFKSLEDMPLPEKYSPSEAVEIFEAKMKTKDYQENFDGQSQKLFNERLKFHRDNDQNPFYDELREKAEEEEIQTPPAGSVAAPEQEPETLQQSVSKQAGQLAALSR